jgi:hypothetical protein
MSEPHYVVLEVGPVYVVVAIRTDSGEWRTYRYFRQNGDGTA